MLKVLQSRAIVLNATISETFCYAANKNVDNSVSISGVLYQVTLMWRTWIWLPSDLVILHKLSHGTLVSSLFIKISNPAAVVLSNQCCFSSVTDPILLNAGWLFIQIILFPGNWNFNGNTIKLISSFPLCDFFTNWWTEFYYCHLSN